MATTGGFIAELKRRNVFQAGLGGVEGMRRATTLDPKYAVAWSYKEDPRLALFCKRVGLPLPTESQTKGI